MTNNITEICHERHQRVDNILQIIDQPAAQLAVAGESALRDLFSDANWSSIPCGHFGTWWENILFNNLSWANDLNDDRTRGALVNAWFLTAGDMLNKPEEYCYVLQNLPKCKKGETLNAAEWVSHFEKIISSGGMMSLNVARQLYSHIELFHSLPSTLISLGKVIERYATQKRDNDFAAIFLRYAGRLAKIRPEIASGLLDECVNVALLNIVLLHALLAEYLKEFSIKDDEEYGWIVKSVEKEMEKIKDKKLDSQIREKQNLYIPRFQHRPVRPRRMVTPTDLYRITIFGQGDAPYIQGEIVDVSCGYLGMETYCARGIRFMTKDWDFATGKRIVSDPLQRYGTLITRHEIVATPRRKTKLDSIILGDGLWAEVSWPGNPKESFSCPTWTIKAAPYPAKYNIDAGAAVVFLTDPKDDIAKTKFLQWQEHVMKDLEDFDYGRAGQIR